MKYYDREDWPGFLSAIRANPDDDLPRLVCADWLEENGEPERAEFVRLQCDPLYTVPCGQVSYPLAGVPGQEAHAGIELGCTTLLIGKEPVEPSCCPQCQLRHRAAQLLCARDTDTDTERHIPHPFTGNGWTAYTVLQYERGFISRVRAPLAVLVGGECGRCGGVGHLDLYSCPGCYLSNAGTGRTPGVLRELLRREPLGPDGIEVSDREPDPQAVSEGMNIGWIRDAEDFDPRNRPDVIPADVYDLLECGSEHWDSVQWVKYPTESAARISLSRAVYAVCSTKSEVPT